LENIAGRKPRGERCGTRALGTAGSDGQSGELALPAE